MMLLLTTLCSGYEWLYPVGSFIQDDHTKLYVIYQKSIDHLELWLWDPESKIATKALLSTHTPAALRQLPDATGFSFIDAGRIRIKYADKRSAKTIDIYEPIYDINPLTWQNSHQCYFSARRLDLFEIFMSCTHGHLISLAQQATSDCMYPTIINDSLFYIKRYLNDDTYHYSLVQSSCTQFDCPYELPEEEKIAFLNSKKSVVSNNKERSLVEWGTDPIAFLHMINERCGFFIKHPALIDKHDPLLACSYYQIHQDGEKWNTKKLFDFALPTYILFDNELRLYESMLPLIPLYNANHIYYLNAQSENVPLRLYDYNLITNCSTELSHNNHIDESVVGPLISKKMLYYGGVVSDEQTNQHHPKPVMWIQDDAICFDLPVLPIS